MVIAAGAALLTWWRLQPREVTRLTITELERAGRSGSKDPALYRELTFRLLNQRQYPEAQSWLARARVLDPFNGENANLLGMLRAQQGDMDGAAAAFREAVQLAPQSVEPHLNLGRLGLARGSVPLAAEEFERARALAPKDPEALTGLSLALAAGGYSVKAKSYARQALAIAPRSPEAHAALGQIYADFGQPKEARDELRRAMELGDSSARTMAYLGLAYAILPLDPGDPATALRYLKQAEERGDSSPQLHYGIGLAYQARGERKQAEAAFKYGLRVSPASEGMYYGLAEVYQQSGRQAESRRLRERYAALVRARQVRESLQARVQNQPDRVPLRMSFVDLLISQGHFDEAVFELRKVLELEPNNETAHAQLLRTAARAAAGEGDHGKTKDHDLPRAR